MVNDDNLRAEHRQRALKGASIIIDINTSEIACTVRNIHSRGAELRIPAEVQVPDNFLLYIPTDAKGYRSVVRWRAGNRMGVEFLAEEPKPHWHYG
ncbi:PilZ domain-containing protein [Aliihoeflea aestuarii]|nr:PilZ domain-containing protein [Aliihoeflea aestuarii]